MSNHSLKGKSVLIGGGAKNLGGRISRTFASDGARICVHYNSGCTKADADKTVAEITAAGGEAFATQGDFTKVADVAAAFAEAKKRFGGIDIAINTAGKVLRKPIVETTEKEFDTMFDVNAKAAFFFIKQAGIRSERRRQDHHAGDFPAGGLHGRVFDLCRRQSAGGRFHSRRRQGVREARHLGKRNWARADGYAVLLRAGNAGARGLPQIAIDERRANQD